MNDGGLSDAQSESGIIGTLLLHPDFVAHSENLRPSYFTEAVNGNIYWAVHNLYKQGIETMDEYNLSMELQKLPCAQDGARYDYAWAHEAIPDYARVARGTLKEYQALVNNVIALAFKRDLLKRFDRLSDECRDSGFTLEKLNNTVYNELEDLTQKYIVTTGVHLLGEDIDAYWNEIVSRRTQDGQYGMASKYKAFGEYFTYEKGELVVVQAKYKQGKSVFLMNEAVHKLQNGIPTLVVDSEMPTRLYVERLLAHMTHIDIRRIKSGDYGDAEEEKLRKTREWMRKQPFVHVYEPSLTNEQLYSLCRMLKYKMDLKFVVYDYLKSNAKTTGENYNVLGAKCDFLKNDIAGKLDIPVLAAAQLNRNGDVADSLKINRYLSVGIKWERKSQEMIARDGLRCGNAFAKVFINRLGKQMYDDDDGEYIDFTFDGDTMTIEEAEQHDRKEEF